MRKRICKKKKSPKRIILAICEGETEAAYLDLLRQHYRLPIEIKYKITGNKINKRLVNKYVDELGLQRLEDCLLFYIYDMDVINIISVLNNLEGQAILSNPCLELWFLLHSTSYNRSVSSEEVLTTLKKSSDIWKNYKKGKFSREQRKHLIANLNTAVSNAKRLTDFENPSSNMHILIDALEKEINR